MTVDKYLPYRGEIRGVTGVGGTVAFVTLDPERQAGGLYRLDADTLDLASVDLPAGAVALSVVGEELWLAGGDGQLLVAPASGGAAPTPRGAKFDLPAAALAALADGRVAALVGSRVVVLAARDGQVLQALDLPEAGTALASDPTGRWLAAGGAKGSVAVFDGEGAEFVAGGSGRLHEASVAALLFEADDLRFFSASSDGKLLTTHARGQLEPEDKGRGNNHADLVAALAWGPGDRLLSGSRDGSIKSWPRAGGVKPSTTRDGVGRVVGLAVVAVHDRPRLVAACDDNTLRLLPIDPSGKLGEPLARVHDAYAAARHELEQAEAPRREAAIRTLAGYGDGRSIDLIAEQVGADADHALRLRAAEALAASGHPKAPPLLEQYLGHRDEAVRVASFGGLRRLAGESSLRPIDLALKVEKADVGRLAVEALVPLARADDQALARLVAALDARTLEVRQAALLALESVHPADSPEANLLALGSKHADVRRGGLLRLHRRHRLADPAVQSAVHRALEDADPTVRQVAFLLALQGRARLLATLRARDPELARQLDELEGTAVGAQGPAAPKARGKAKAAEPGGDGPPGPDDVEPLLQASAARALDTSLRGARGLAILGDPRALGLLLQLSREDQAGARAEVCRALAALDDPRAVERLRSLIHDDQAAVRDAAFTALERIHQADPLLAAESGLDATHEDVRRRGLQALVAHAREPGRLDACRPLLLRALNDESPGVRSEAFKATLGLKVDGAGAGPLRFAARSVHADVRLEVLVEVQAQVAEPWGLDLLLGFFDDADPSLRDLAFEFAIKKSKGLEFLDAALGSRYPDLRLKAVEGLIRKHTAAAQKLLARALDDEDRAVRRAALGALVEADALPALAPALANAHPDVRLRAAKAFARHGDARALGPLIALATAPEPDHKERRADWLELAESALDGLGELGDPAAVAHLIPALDGPHGALRREAALALARCCTPDRADPLRQALGHADPEVKYRAAYGLACLGDHSVAALVFSPDGGRIVSVGGQVAAALALGDEGEGRLILFLDDPKPEVRTRALLLLLMREWKDPRGDSARALAALASRTPQLRLVAARAVEALADPGTFPRFVADLVNDRRDAPAWKVPAATVDALAELLVHGDRPVRVRTARLLRHLDAAEQHAFDQAWRLHEARFAPALADLRARAKTRPVVAARYDAGQLRDLAFGAYVGLVREPSGAKNAGTDAQATRARQSALAHLLTLARSDPRHARGAVPVFVQALGDPAQGVRSQAFDQLQALGLAPARLAAEALESGHVDLGVRGFELLTTGVSAEEGRLVLEQAMLGRPDDLAGEAARLLIARLGPVPVATRALGAANETLRREAVGILASEYDRDPAARDPLRRALASRYAAVREAAAFELATKKDPAAFDALVGLLVAATESRPQRRAIAALEALGDPRGAAALLDRALVDPTGTALLDDLARAAGRSRDGAAADRLLTLFDREPKARESAFAALVMLSGYDQPIADPDDERPDDRWLRDQHPRRDDLLARLLDRFAAPGDAKFLTRLLPGARWARSALVGPPLAALAGHPDEATRRAVVEALGWRLRRRDGDPEPLRRALNHRDPGTQFLAAEGLALGGRPDGLNVLLASIDFAADLDHRRRAVLALGELGDEGAFDALLKLANEDGHALQEAAAEAIGHLGRSPRAAEVFKTLERQSKGDGGVAEAALRGLRWLDTRAAWGIIRDQAVDSSAPFNHIAIELLGFDDADDPATGDVLLKILATDRVPEIAFESARRVFGPDSLEPDYAVLRNPAPLVFDDLDLVIERVRERGDPARIFAILPKCSAEVRDGLAGCLLNRADPPIVAAKGVLDSPDAAIATLAAQLLGRAGPAARESAGAVAAALDRWRRAWEEARAAENPGVRHRAGRGNLAEVLTPCVRGLAWAAGRVGVGDDALAAVAGARPDDPEYRPIRREALLALAGRPGGPAVVAALESAALAGDPDDRAVAAAALARLAPDQAAGVAGRMLADAAGWRPLTRGGAVDVAGVLRSAAGQVHSQGLVLPALIDRGEVDTLAGVLADRKRPEAARLGALEGLGAMAREDAEAALRRVGGDESEEDEIRKAAWRSLRRSRRGRTKAGAGAGGTP